MSLVYFYPHHQPATGQGEAGSRAPAGSAGARGTPADAGPALLAGTAQGELFFRNGSQMMVTAVTTQPRFAARTPNALFSQSFAVTSSRVSYDVSPDGQRFIVVGPSESEQPVGQLNVVLHGTEELKRLVPVN